MKLAWHIAKKDLRELSGITAVYAALIAVKLVLGSSLIRSGALDPNGFMRTQTYGNLCIGLEVLIGYVVVAAFVHENPLIGTRAEWMTRPISGGQLLGAKLLGLGAVMIVLPLALGLPWWLSNGYGLHEIEAAAAETLLRQAVVLVPALALAVLTDGFDRYVIWLLVLFGVGFAASKLPPVKAAMSTPDVAETREWLSLTIAAITAFFIVLNQFFTRRTGRGVAMLSVGLALTALAAWWWPHSLERFRREAVEGPLESIPAEQVQLVFERARTVRRAGAEPELRVGVAVTSVPTDLKLRSGHANQMWKWPSVRLERSGEMSEETYGTLAPALRALRLEVPRFDPAWFQADAERPVRMGLLGQPIFPDGIGLNVKTALRPAYLARVRRDPPGYELAAEFELFRPEVHGEEPLCVNGRLDRGLSHVRIAHIETIGNALRVTLVECSPEVRWDSPGRYVGTGFAQAGEAVEYFLVNRKRGNATRGTELIVQRARFGTLAIAWRTLQFSAPREWIAGSWVEIPGWFDGLTLAKISNRRVAEVQRTLTVEKLLLGEEKASDLTTTVGAAARRE